MTTFKRICIKDHTVGPDSVGNKVELKRGHEYITSQEKAGDVTVFTQFWVDVPVALFAGEERFT